MKTFKTIVWATDGSRRGDRALPRVRELCQRNGSKLCIVHVAPTHRARGLPAPRRHAAEERAIAKLKAQTSALRRHGVRASLHVIRGATGSPARHILDIARAVDADLLIVAGRGRSPLRAAVQGSVTQQLLAGAPCPVLSVPAPGRSGDRAMAREHRRPAVAA